MTHRNYAKNTVISGLLVAAGILLPLFTAHGFSMPGNILLPMHIPVLLCGFLCGPMYGFLCGLILPLLNSLLTSMPQLFPMAVIMTGELATYGLVSGILAKPALKTQKLFMLYISLIVAMIAGRIVYGLVAWILLFTGATAGKFSVISAVVSGLPGIIIQLILIPAIVKKITKPKVNLKQNAIDMVNSGKATCVTVRNNKTETTGSPRGIAYIIELYENNMLDGAFVADKIVGKAAAMVFTLGKVTECYAQNISEGALKWLQDHEVAVEYKNLSPNITNRKGDGTCPMELTVAHIDNEKEAISALKKKIEELKNN